MTDAEKLVLIEAYVVSMSPIYRPQMLLPPEEMAYNSGYDTAMYEAQQDLLKILEAE